MRIKKLLILPFVFGVFFIGCDLVYVNIENIDETEKNTNDTTEVYLSENVWTDGKISKNGQRDTYYISVTKGMRYFIYMNNAYDGDGTKIAYTRCRINDGTASVYLWDHRSNANAGEAYSVFSTPYAFTAISTGTATVTVTSDYDRGKDTGTYAIKYASRLEYDFMISEGVWKDDEIKAKGQKNKYYINVTAGKKYSVRLNDANDGDGTKTAHIGLRICYNDSPTYFKGSSIPLRALIYYNDESAYFKGADKLYSKPYTFIATNTDVISVMVESDYDWGENTGTYAIKYEETAINYLAENEWTDGEFFRNGQTDIYYISVTKGMRYFVYMNNAYYGDGTKTAYTGLKISHSDGTVICDSYYNLWNEGMPYTEPYAFIASSTGTVTVTVASHNGNWETGTGTYAIIYACQQEYVLSNGVWKDDSIIPYGQTNKYYINVTAGKKYSIRLNDVHDGDGTKTANTSLKISHSDGSDIYGYEIGFYSKPHIFTATSNGTVTVTVASNAIGIGIGTYAIKYEETDIDYLVENEWMDGEFFRWGQVDTYYISVTEKTRYFIYTNNGYYNGDGTKTAYTGLKISHSDGTVICDNYDNASVLYTKPYTFIASSSGTITITVASANDGWERGEGTYAIKYTSQPVYYGYMLSKGEWKDDEITAVGQTNKYSINVIKGRRYFIYMNNAYGGDRTKSAYTGLIILPSNGTPICNYYGNAQYLYSTPYSFIASSSDTVTITVAAASSDYGDWEKGTGTYAIKYTEGN